MFRRLPLLLVTILFLVWSLSLFIAPLTLTPDTVRGLDGAANRVDYAEKWSTFPLYPQIIYYLGDALCHQKSERSFELNGNQLPVCARDQAIFTGFAVGLLIAFFVPRGSDPAAGILAIFPVQIRNRIGKRLSASTFLIILLICAFVPMGIDGMLQLLTDYESTNVYRVLTGLPAGIITGLVLGAILQTLSMTKKRVQSARCHD